MDPLTRDYPMLTPYQFASNTPIQAIDLDGLEARIVVHEIGKNSTMSYVVDLNDPKVNPTLTTYADQKKYGKRGDLTVIKSPNSDMVIKKFNISFTDRVKNLFDANSAEPEQVKGGIMFTLSYGQGKEKRFSPDAEIGPSLDDLFDVFGVAKSTGNSLKTFPDVFQYIMDAKGLGETVQNKVNPDSELPRRFNIAIDSSCNTCEKKPHDGLPYRRFDADGMVIDTIDPNKPKE